MTPPPNLPAAPCPHCGAQNPTSHIYCHNCGGKLPAHPDLAPPQPEKGKGGEVEIIGGATAEMRAEFDAVLAKLRDMPDDEFAQKMQEANADAATHALTDEEIRIRIAEWMGYENVAQENGKLFGHIRGDSGWLEWNEIPNFCTSLDAIASAEARLMFSQRQRYYEALREVCSADLRKGKQGFRIADIECCRAIATQRAQALIQTIQEQK